MLCFGWQRFYYVLLLSSFEFKNLAWKVFLVYMEVHIGPLFDNYTAMESWCIAPFFGTWGYYRKTATAPSHLVTFLT